MKSSKMKYITLFLYVFVLTEVQGQFQRMRLRTGSYKVGGSSSTRIPASCIDMDLKTPTKQDLFKVGSESITVTRTKNGKAETKTITDAIDSKWIKIKGNGRYTSIDAEINNPSDNFSYKINVSESGVLGVDSKSVSQASIAIKQKQAALKRLDDFEDDLNKKFGENNRISEIFHNEKNEIDWKIMSHKGSNAELSSEINTFIKDFKSIFIKKNGKESLEFLTIINEKKLSSTQIDLVNKSWGTKMPLTYDLKFEKDLLFWNNRGNLLKETFGEDSDIYLKFNQKVKSDFISPYGSFNHNLEGAVLNSTENIIDSRIKTWNNEVGANDYFSLINGEQLSVKQADVIENLTGVKLGVNTGVFDDCLVIRSRFLEPYTYTTTTTKNYADKLNDKTFVDILKDKKQIYIDGRVSDDLAKVLSENNIHFVRPLESIKPLSQLKPEKIKLIFVASKDKNKVKQLFECDDKTAEEIIKTVEEIEKIPNALVVDDVKEYETAIRDLSQNERPLPIFHNGTKGIMFEKPIKTSNLEDGISCNTYKTDRFSFKSTDYIDYKCVVGALTKAQVRHNSITNTYDEFLQAFAYEFTKCLKFKNQKVKYAILVGGGIATGAGVYYAIEGDDN